MNFIADYMPGMYTIVCTVLAFFIPFTVYKINERIHKAMDPPWKQEDRIKEKSEQ